MSGFLNDLPRIALTLVLVFPAIILHEVSHGYVAYLLGDTTAKDRGRLTLNPISHVDPFGTLLLPVMMLLLSNGTTALGYAKPVPVNPNNFSGNRRWGWLLVGIAGPAANLALAIVFGLVLRFADPFIPTTGVAAIVRTILELFTFFNLMLMFFNLIPIPPLDGSRVVQYFLPPGALRAYEQLERYGFLILIAVLFFLPGVLGGYLNVTAYPVFHLITGL